MVCGVGRYRLTWCWATWAALWTLLPGCGGGGAAAPLTHTGADAVEAPDPLAAVSVERVSLPDMGVSLEIPSEWELTTLGGVVVIAPRGVDRDAAAVVVLRHAPAGDPREPLSALLGTPTLSPSGATTAWTNAAGDAGRQVTLHGSPEGGGLPTRAELYSLSAAQDVWVAVIYEGGSAALTERLMEKIAASLTIEGGRVTGGTP